MSIHLEIGGGDYSAYIRDLDLEPSGPGKVGTGSLHLSVPGSVITDRMTVKVWRVDGSGDLVRRYFGGYVGGAGTGRLSVTPTKTWDIPLQDYALAGKRLVADVDLVTDSGTTLAAGTFADQVLDAVTRWQEMNGTPSVYIDATSKVVNLTGGTVLPAIPGLNGKRLDFVLQQICNNARVVTPALRPRWRWGLDNTFGPGAVFGPPVLWVYNAADVTSTVQHFSDATNTINIGTYKRTTQSPALVNRRQSVYGDPPTVVTSEGTASHSTYPFDLAGDGYWGDEALEDKDSTDSTQAQAVLDRNRQATEYPRETLELQSRLWAEPGETVLVTWAGDGLSGVGYRVAGVRLTFLKSDADTPICAYTLGQVPREVGISDGDDIGNPPVVGDHVGPGRPTNFVGTSAFVDADGTTTLSGTLDSPADSDYEYAEIRYRERLNAGAYGNWATLTGLAGDPSTTQPYALPGLHASSPGQTWEYYAVAQAYDHNHNGSPFSTPLTGTSASVADPNPPTSLAYTTAYTGNGNSAATITYGAGAQPPTRDHYLAELTAPNGRTYVYTIPGTATTYTFKDLSPGLVYSLSMVAVTPGGYASGTPATLSITAARATAPGPDPVWWGPGTRDSDSSDTLGVVGVTSSVTGSGARALSTSTVFEGTTTYQLDSGASAATAIVQSEVYKQAAPGATLTYRFIEGNAGAAQGVVELLIWPRDKTGATVGSELVAYTGAPSTVAAGTERKDTYTLPTTSSISQFSFRLRYTGDGTHARSVYATMPDLRVSVGVKDLYLATDSGTTVSIYDLLNNIIMRLYHDGTYGRMGSTADADGLRFSTAGGHQIILTDSSGELDIQALVSLILSAGTGNIDLNATAGTINLTAPTVITTGHQGMAGTAPGIAPRSAAGAGASTALTSGATDFAGQIQLTTGSGASTGGVARLTFATAFAVAPLVYLTPASPEAIEAPLVSGAYVGVDLGGVTPTRFDVLVTPSGAPLADGTIYFYNYLVIAQPN